MLAQLSGESFALSKLIRKLNDDENERAENAGKWPFAKDVVYLELMHAHPLFSCGIFAVRRGCQLPLHNHPGMTVLTYVHYFIQKFLMRWGVLRTEIHQ